MTIEQYIEKLGRQIKVLEDTDEANYLAASSVHAMQVERIFTDGIASNGTKIGSYSTKDIYINPNSPNVGSKFPPEGKTGKKVHKNGEPYKTKYFAGYRAFRANQGRDSNTVNLDNIGRLKSEYENSLKRDNDNSYTSEIRSQENIDKAVGNQTRFNKTIFGLTNEEAETYTEILTNQLNTKLQNA